jgi:hypothetical protein
MMISHVWELPDGCSSNRLECAPILDKAGFYARVGGMRSDLAKGTL